MGANGVQHRLDLIVGAPVAAHHHRQSAGRRAVHPAAHRRVQNRYAPRRAFVVNAANHRRRVGGQVNIHAAGAGCGHNAAFPHYHGLNIPRHWQRGEHSVLAGHAAGRRIGPLRPHFQQVGGRLPTQVMHGKLVAGLDHIGGHRVAHIADANEPSFHNRSLLNPPATARRAGRGQVPAL